MLALLVAAFAVRAWLNITVNVNWDEFYYLSKIYGHQSGSLAGQFQMFQVHLLGWLTSLPGNEVDQVVAGRFVMLGLGAGSCAFLYTIVRHYFPRAVALLCVLCYLAFSDVIQHGTSFRADPICTFLLLGAACAAVAQHRSILASALAGIAVALSIMITVKTLLFVPVIAAIYIVALAQVRFETRTIHGAGAFAAGAVVGFACLVGLHAALSADIPPANGATLLGASYRKTILLGDFFPRWRYGVRSLLDNPLPWVTVLAGLAMAARGAVRRERTDRYRDLTLICLALPLATLFVYRNAFPYFYVMVLAFSAAASAAFFLWAIGLGGRRSGVARPAMIYGCGAVLALGFATHAGTHVKNETLGQRAVVEAVHRMFPQPVPYIDMCSMIAPFPKVGFFMSSWGVEAYRDAGKPIMARLIEERAPVFVIANAEELYLSKSYEDSGSSDVYRLFREDFETLRTNYVPHWGPLFVAGKQLRFDAGDAPRPVQILIPGTYTVEGHALTVDGKRLDPGSKVYLNKGSHIMGVESTSATVVLRWGSDLYRPDRDPPSPMFTNP